MAEPKILIFGGAFSPPTLAHEAILAALLQLPGFAEVWVMPSGDRQDKQIGVSDRDRLAMLRLVKKERFSNDPRLSISNFELNLPRPTQTFRTVAALDQAFPGTEFWFAFGPDSYISMPSWPGGTNLQRQLKVVLFSSGGPPAAAKGTVQRLTIASTLGDTSSTKARQLIAAGKSPTNEVSEPIARYITEHNLYQSYVEK